MSVSDALPVADGVAAASTSRKAAPLAPRNRAFKGKTDASAVPCNPAHKTARRKYPPQTQPRAEPPQKRLFLLAELQAARKPAQNTKPRRTRCRCAMQSCAQNRAPEISSANATPRRAAAKAAFSAFRTASRPKTGPKHETAPLVGSAEGSAKASPLQIAGKTGACGYFCIKSLAAASISRKNACPSGATPGLSKVGAPQTPCTRP